MERRVKVLWLGEQEILHAVIMSHKNMPTFVFKVNYDGVPDDVVVERVVADPWRRGIGFLVSHPSFDEVPEGMPAPDYWANHEFEKYITVMPTCPPGWIAKHEIMENGHTRLIYEQTPPDPVPGIDTPLYTWDGKLPKPGTMTDRGIIGDKPGYLKRSE